MRPKGVVAAALVLLLGLGVAYLISDELIERGLERAGERVVGAKVEIDNLSFSLTDLSFSLDRLQVANPNDTWKNLIEAGKMSFNMEATPLIRRKVIINDITVADIRVGTKRETDGRLSKAAGRQESGWVAEAKNSLREKLESVPVLNLAILQKQVNVDSLIAAFDVTSLDRLKNLRSRADSTHKKWQTVLAEFNPKDEVERLGQEIQEIKPKEIKGVDDLVSTFERTKTIYTRLNTLKSEVEEKKVQATTGIQQLTESAASVDRWIAEDFESIKSKVNLGEFTPKNIGSMIFGKSLVERFLDLLPYIDLVREYMPVAQKVVNANKVESPPRLVGQDIRFPIRRDQPKFLIEKVFISGATNQADTSQVLRLSGEAKGITSHPRLYGKPLTFELAAKLPQSKAYQVTGLIDHTDDVPTESFRVRGSGFRLGTVKLSPRPYLPSALKVQKSDLGAQLTLNGDRMNFELELVGRPVSFEFPDSLVRDDVISKVTTGVFASIEMLKLTAGIQGEAGDLGLSIRSNIDNILAERVKGVIGESASLARSEIRKQLHQKVEPRKQEVLGLVQSYRNDILSEINNIESGINDKLGMIEQRKKEIEEKIKKEKEKGIKDITKKLSDIIKN